MRRVTAKDIYEMITLLDEQTEEKIDKWLLARVGAFAAGGLKVYQEQVGMDLMIMEKSLRARGFTCYIEAKVSRLPQDPYLIVKVPPPQGD